MHKSAKTIHILNKLNNNNDKLASQFETKVELD